MSKKVVGNFSFFVDNCWDFSRETHTNLFKSKSTFRLYTLLTPGVINFKKNSL